MPIQFFIWLFIGLCLIIFLMRVRFYKALWIFLAATSVGFLEEAIRQQCFWLFVPFGVFLLGAIYPFIQDIRLSWKLTKRRKQDNQKQEYRPLLLARTRTEKRKPNLSKST